MNTEENKRKERRSLERIKISYYLPIISSESYELLGILSDITTKGLLVNSQKKLPLNQQFKLHLDLTGDGFDQSSINFIAQVKNVRPDRFEPGYYNIGFEMLNLSITNIRTIKIIMEKYSV